MGESPETLNRYGMNRSLEDVRTDIDIIDLAAGELIASYMLIADKHRHAEVVSDLNRLFAQRMVYTEEVGTIKSLSGDDAVQLGRYEEVKSNYIRMATEHTPPIDPAIFEEVFEQVHRASVHQQQRIAGTLPPIAEVA